MRAYLAVLLLAGCSFDPSGVGGGDDVPDDAGEIDADPTAPDAVPADAFTCATWAALNVDPCAPALPAPDLLDLGTGQFEYDTDSGVLSAGGAETIPPSALIAQSGGPELRVLNTINFNLGSAGSLTVVGTRPLVIVVHGSASIAGTIDVSARVEAISGASAPGPGGNDAVRCATGTGDPGNPATANAEGGGGGGGGGAFGDNGGDGGDGNGGGHGNKGGKGSNNGSADLEPLRGGCGGGAGGDDGDGLIDASGRAGDGGGAIEITARAAISVAGTIRAGGSGGAAAQLTNAGAGGAGSGGAILLDGEIATLSITAVLCANGGGGGEGGQILAAADVGDDATCSATLRAQGGELSADGGNGGDGGFAGGIAGANGSNGASGAGGGGGGGGVGRIRVRGRTTRDVPVAAVLSPDATR